MTTPHRRSSRSRASTSKSKNRRAAAKRKKRAIPTQSPKLRARTKNSKRPRWSSFLFHGEATKEIEWRHLSFREGCSKEDGEVREGPHLPVAIARRGRDGREHGSRAGCDPGIDHRQEADDAHAQRHHARGQAAG